MARPDPYSRMSSTVIVSDLDFRQHSAEISAGLICVGERLAFTPDEFIFSGMVVIRYDEQEERQLEQLGVLANLRTR